MRKIAMPIAACIAALFIASAAHAASGNVKLSWSGCNTSPITDLTVAPGDATGAKLYCFVTGQSDPTTAYQVQILYGDALHFVPDAWRFDPQGCQGGAFVVLRHIAPAAVAKTCPTFQDAGGPHASIQIQDLSFSPPALPYPTTLMRITVADSYPAGNVPIAATNYFLMDAEFDHTFSVIGPTQPPINCGGLEDPICFHLVSASYIINDSTNNEIPFQFGGTGGFASANGAGGSCLADPAHPTTWGAIKGQYRN